MGFVEFVFGITFISLIVGGLVKIADRIFGPKGKASTVELTAAQDRAPHRQRDDQSERREDRGDAVRPKRGHPCPPSLVGRFGCCDPMLLRQEEQVAFVAGHHPREAFERASAGARLVSSDGAP